LAEAAAAEDALVAKTGKFRWDPPGYVAFAFPCTPTPSASAPSCCGRAMSAC
jgi:hypothetical protein